MPGPLSVLAVVLLGVVTATSPAVAQEVVVAQGVDAESIDPHLSYTTSTVNIFLHVFDGLLHRDADLALKPALATAWRTIDPNTWELDLRQGVTFHDGTPFTAEDVKFSFERVLQNPGLKSPLVPNINAVTRVEIVDPYKVRLVTKDPYPILLARLTVFPIVPARVLREKGDAEFRRHPVGTGPYRFVEWVKDDRLRLEANPRYWGGAPRIARITFKPIPEAATRIAALLSGSADIITNVPPDLVAEIGKGGRADVASVASERTLFMPINTLLGGPTADKRVRQALNHAVNRQDLVKFVLNGFGVPIPGPITPNHFGFDPSVPPYAHDEGRARALLAEAGVPNGFETTIYSPTGRYLKDRELAEAIGGQLARVGVRAKIATPEWANFVQLATSKKIGPLYLMGWSSQTYDADGVLFSTLFTGNPWSSYSNKDLDALLLAARGTLDPEARKRHYARALALIRDEAPMIFLHRQVDVYGVARRITWKPRSDERIWLVEAGLKTN
jgi:peptide/nickel transport system substrate-binding protein